MGCDCHLTVPPREFDVEAETVRSFIRYSADYLFKHLFTIVGDHSSSCP